MVVGELRLRAVWSRMAQRSYGAAPDGFLRLRQPSGRGARFAGTRRPGKHRLRLDVAKRVRSDRRARRWRHRARAGPDQRNFARRRRHPARSLVDHPRTERHWRHGLRKDSGVARLVSLAVLACAFATPARADPILTPIIASIIASVGLPASISVFGITFGTAAILTGLVTTAIGIGLAILFAPRPKLPPPENGVIAVQQNLPYRIYVYGRGRVAGAWMLKESIASYLCYVAALAGHFVDGFEVLFLNDDQVTIGTSGQNFIGTVVAGADGRYGGSTIYIETRQGLATETAFSFITSLLPTYWDATHRGDGQASLGMTCGGVSAQNFVTTYPYGAPAPSAVLRGYRVFDPRDPTQNEANAATWKWSQNAALCILHFLCFSEFGFRASYSDAIAPFIVQWIQAANDCDDAVALKSGGTEPRYRLGGWTTTEQPRITTLLAMLQCCDGFLSRRGAGYWLQVGKYYPPTVTLTDDDIVGFIIQTDVSSEDKVNEAIAYWSDPDNGYVTVDTDPVINAADQSARGGAPHKAQLQLTWVQSVGQASRLLAREMFRQGVTVRGTLTLGWSGINASYERWIAINSNSIPRLSGVVIENRKAVISAKTRTVTLDFILSGPALDDYAPATQESSIPAIPQRPATVGLPVPTGVSVIPELSTDASGASTLSLAVAWTEPFFNGVAWNLNYVVRWRLTNAGGGTPGAWTQQSFTTPTIAAGVVSVQTGNVTVGTSLDVEVASVGTGASLSTWSALVTVSTVLANVAPAPPAWTSAVGSAGHAALTVVAPPSPNFAKVQFYRAAHGSAFATATAIGSPVTGAPNATLTYTDAVASGTYDYFVVSETGSSVASAPAGPETAIVT